MDSEALAALKALLASDDWPALEQMGQETTPVKTKSLLDLSDYVERIIQSETP